MHTRYAYVKFFSYNLSVGLYIIIYFAAQPIAGVRRSLSLRPSAQRYVFIKMNLYKETLLWFFLFSFVAVSPCAASAETGRLALPVQTSVERIVIDPGFGGKDFGALGYIEGVYAKDVNLQISRKLAERIREELHLETTMTRTRDQFLTLEQRVTLANMQRGDLLISIHCNAHENHGVYGIETYFLNLASDAKALKVVKAENAGSKENMSQLEMILDDLMVNTKINQSKLLASYVQASLYKHMKDRYSFIRNRGIKQAPFYVLIGAEMPSILIEVSFLSNPRECKRLVSEDYQDNLCEGILKGIKQYITSIQKRN